MDHRRRRGEAPIDLDAAAFRTLDEVREHAGELGQPWWSISPFGEGIDLGGHDVEAYRETPSAPWATSRAGSGPGARSC